MTFLVSSIIVLLFGFSAFGALSSERRVQEIPPEDQRIRVIIDTDAACEIDDQYAIALALLSPEKFQIEGFIGAHFGEAGGPEGISKSVEEIERILEQKD